MTQKTDLIKRTQYTRKKIQSYSYGLIDQIGKGYSSRVYRGRHDETNDKVAVKVIDLKMLKNEINRQLLDSEIQILKELKGTPNILHLCDIFTTKNNTYIVTQLCVSDLSQIVKKPLGQDKSIKIMQSIIAGYLQVYKKNVVHRDLKPANILITEKNHIKIADFGFAIKVDSLTKDNKYNVGSPLYMAPQSLKKNQYSFKTDIWALGIILYQLLFNETPWKAKNQRQLLKTIQREQINKLLQGKQISARAKLFLIKTLQINKNQRMGPEQLQFFQLTQPQNILSEKIVNSLAANHSKENTKRAVTSMNGQENEQNMKEQDIENKIRLKTQVGSKKTESVNKKNISKILLSQVHFCRFLFKLLQKINSSASTGILKGHNKNEVEAINKNLTSIIRYKIQNLNNFAHNNFINCVGYKAYKLTSDYEKLIAIAKEYSIRYKNELQKYWDQSYNLSIDPICKMITVLYKLLEQSMGQMEDPKQQISNISKDIVILDYLVTTKQLVQIIRTNAEDYQKFANVSRIEDIVDGKLIDIDIELCKKIMERVKLSMQRKVFLSFGGQFTLQGNYTLL